MAGNNTAEAQEPIKKAKAYKVTSKAFTKRREAAGEVAEAKTKVLCRCSLLKETCIKRFMQQNQQRQPRKSC